MYANGSSGTAAIFIDALIVLCVSMVLTNSVMQGSILMALAGLSYLLVVFYKAIQGIGFPLD